MRAALVLAALCTLAAVGACEPKPPAVRMTVEQRDAATSACRNRCDQQRRDCVKPKRPAEQPPDQIDQERWKQAWAEGQELAQACERKHRTCLERCLE